MNLDFTASKNVLNIVEFDKSNKLWRFCSNPDEILNYESVKKVSIIEKLQEKKRTANILNNIASTAGGGGALGGQPSTYMKVQIKVFLNDGTEVVSDISKDYLMMNTLDYHADRRKAEEVKKGLKILEKRNQK